MLSLTPLFYHPGGFAAAAPGAVAAPSYRTQPDRHMAGTAALSLGGTAALDLGPHALRLAGSAAVSLAGTASLSLGPHALQLAGSAAVSLAGTAALTPNQLMFDLRFDQGDSTSAMTAAGLTYSRSSIAWTMKGVQVASGTPRVDASGLLFEGARTNLSLRSQELDNASWTTSTASVTANAVTAPDGVVSGDTYVENGASSHIRTAAITTVSGTTYSFSIFAKRSNTDWFRILVADNSGLATNVARAWFNLASGTAGVASVAGAGFTAPSNAIVSVGGGWFRCSLTFTTTVTTIYGGVQTADADASTTRANVGAGAGIGSAVHLWQSQIEAGAWPSSPIVTTSAAVTRARDVLTATARPAADIQQGTVAIVAGNTALAGPVTPDSMQFYRYGVSNRVVLFRAAGAGTSINVGVTGIAANMAPGSVAFGSGFAAAVTWSVAASRAASSLNGGTVASAAGTLTLGSDNEYVGYGNSAGSESHANLRRVRRYLTVASDADLQAAATSELVYDLDLIGGANAASITAAGFTFARSGTAWDLDGVAYSSGIPRITAQGLLLEAARTNICLQSQTFANATWTKAGVTATDAAAVAPNGASVASSFIESALNEGHNASQNVSFTSGTTYAFSCYAKALAGTRYLRLILASTAFGTAQAVNFDLSTGAATATSGSPTTTAVSIGNGWWRCSIVAAATATVSSAVQVAMALNTLGTSTYAGDGTSGILLFQSQVEASSFPTSPMVTTASSVTRNAETCVATRAAGLLDRGSVAIDATHATGFNPSTHHYLWQADDGTPNNRVFAYKQSGTTNQIFQLNSGGSTFATLSTSGATALATFKQAARWSSVDAASSIGGAAALTDTSVTLPVGLVTERLGTDSTGGQQFNGYIRRIRRYSTPATDARLVAMST
jgi:hypothetical protein